MRIRLGQAVAILGLAAILPIPALTLPAFSLPKTLSSITAYSSQHYHRIRQLPTTTAPTSSPASTLFPPIIPPASSEIAASPASSSPTTDVPTTAPTTDVPTTAPPTTAPPTTDPPTTAPPVTTQTIETIVPSPGTVTTTASSNTILTPTSSPLTGTTTSSGTLSSTGTVPVSGSISGSRTLIPVTTGPSSSATTTPGPVSPLTNDNTRTWIIVGISAAGVLLLASIRFFVIRRRKQKRERRRLFNINGGLDSLTSISRASVGGDDREDGNREDDDDDLDSEKAFFMANPPARVRSPQSPHSDNHDLNIKTPLDQFEAQKTMCDNNTCKGFWNCSKSSLLKLNALVERYRVTYSRPQSPHSPVLSETRLSTRLSFFGADDELEFEEEELTSDEIQKLELKGDERLQHVPLEEGPFRDQGEIEDGNVELQRLKVNHHHHRPFADQDIDTTYSARNIFDDPNAVFEADFEVASIIIRSGSINLLSDSLELPDEQQERNFDKGKGTTCSIRDSNSFLGFPLSTSVSTDDLQAGFSLRDSNSTLALSSTVRERYFDSIMDEALTDYSGDIGSTSGSGNGGGSKGERSSTGTGSGSRSAIAVVPPELERERPTRIQTGQTDLDRQREREQSAILLKAIAQAKAQYVEQYRQIHEDLAHLQLNLE